MYTKTEQVKQMKSDWQNFANSENGKMAANGLKDFVKTFDKFPLPEKIMIGALGVGMVFLLVEVFRSESAEETKGAISEAIRSFGGRIL